VHAPPPALLVSGQCAGVTRHETFEIAQRRLYPDGLRTCVHSMAGRAATGVTVVFLGSRPYQFT
jgi:hypothetical protein